MTFLAIVTGWFLISVIFALLFSPWLKERLSVYEMEDDELAAGALGQEQPAALPEHAGLRLRNLSAAQSNSSGGQ